MRTITAILLAVLLGTSGLAQAEAETPRQSFEKFIDAVLSDTLTEEERAAQFERYFDFEQWLNERGGESTEAGRAAMKADWFKLFESAEFRDSYREREVRVIEEPTPDSVNGKAELVIAMKGEGTDEKFRVMLKVSADGTWWRWYAIPQILAEATPRTPAEQIKTIEDALARIARERASLDELEDDLRRELAKLRATQAEADTDSSPKAVVTAAWNAIEKGDVDALLDCHTTAQVAKSKLETVKASIDNTRERLMSWEVQQATIDENDDTFAVVPVRLTLRRTGEPDVRTISVRVVKVGDLWKIDEAP